MNIWFALIVVSFGALVTADVIPPADTIILIRPEDMRIVPKKVLEQEFVTQAHGPSDMITAEERLEEIKKLFPIPLEKAPEQAEEKPEETGKEKERKPEEERKWKEQQEKEKPKKEEQPEKIPESYIVSGVVHLVFDNTTEPFTLWYDGEKKRSRVDLGGRGTFSTVQLEQENCLYRYEIPIEGSAFTKPVCIKTEGTEKERVKALQAIPDLTKFKKVADDRFKREVVDEKLSSVHTFWLTVDKRTFKPIRLEVFAKSTRTHKTTGHYIVEYKHFVAKKPENVVFKLPEEIQCRTVVGLTDLKDVDVDREFVDQRHFFVNPFSYYVDPELHQLHEREVDKLFEGFCRRFNKRYDDEEERELRRTAFCHNYLFINVVNRAGFSYRVKLNRMADRTNDELRQMLGVRGVGNLRKAEHLVKFNGKRHNLRQIDQVPDWIDWRNLGALTPIRRQKECGSDWAIAATKVLEAAFYLRTNDLVKLSEQELLDCSHETGNQDCRRGTPWQAFEYVRSNGIASEVTYGPLTSRKADCRSQRTKISAAIKNWILVDKDQNKLKEALVKNGPITALIDAGHKSFFFYASGIYREDSCRVKAEEMNHAVVVAGFSELDENRRYWLIDNSFGTDWGLNGYMLLDRNSKDGNTCGILSAPAFVEM